MTDVDNELPTYTGNLKAEYYQAYFGDQWGYYLPIMIYFESGKKFSFNVWAFFFGMLWQLYRRLYLAILIFIIIVIVESALENWVFSYWSLTKLNTILINFITTIIFGIIYGYTGNYFLMRKLQDKISQILATENDEELILEKIRKAGSKNTLGLTLVLISVFLIFLLALFYSKIWG